MTTFLTIEEAAALLQLNETTIRTYVRNGKLPAKRVTGGKQVLIEEKNLMALLSDARTEEASTAFRDTSVSASVVEFPTARQLLRMSRAQRAPYLEASALAALPIYAADLAKPEAERELTADLETGDIYDEEDYARGIPANA
jgi:excisionase family DNA binding protein